MTTAEGDTPASGEGGDASPPGEPTLPTPTLPTLPKPTLPTLPTPAAPDAAPPSTGSAQAFDARAMVEAGKRRVANPVYGQLPVATPEARAAAEARRQQMRRKRRRNHTIGWFVALVMLAGVAATGWLAYREFRSDEGNAAPNASAPATPTSTATDSGLLTAIERAKQAVGAVPTTAAPLVGLSGTTFDFLVTRWSGAAPDAVTTSYHYLYDTTIDRALVGVQLAGTPGARVALDASHRTTQYTDGTFERFPRSIASLDPGPDVAFARLVTEEMVFPAALRAYAVSAQFTAPVEIDGVLQAFDIDIAAFAAAAPEEFAAWQAIWIGPQIDDPTLVDPAGRQLASASAAALDDVPTHQTLATHWAVGGAALFYVIAPEGHVAVAFLEDRVHDVRVMYELLDVTQTGSLSETPIDPALVWTDAPL